MPGKYELKAALANCKYGGDSMDVYFSRLKKLWDKFENYRQLPSSIIDSEILNYLTKKREKRRKYTNFLWDYMMMYLGLYDQA